VRLSYLCFSLGYPLKDSLFLAADHALALDLQAWARFSAAHPWLWQSQRIAYQSHFLQPLVAVFALAFWRPREANAQLLIALIISLATTLATAALLPSIGPIAAYQLEAPTSTTVSVLRTAPDAYALPYAGIVAFPSFHSALAILFTYACRGYPLLFAAATAFNLRVVVSIPLCGDHYFIDVLAGGVAVAFGASLARLIAPVRGNKTPAKVAADVAPG
jgi:hypothetical protein